MRSDRRVDIWLSEHEPPDIVDHGLLRYLDLNGVDGCIGGAARDMRMQGIRESCL